MFSKYHIIKVLENAFKIWTAFLRSSEFLDQVTIPPDRNPSTTRFSSCSSFISLFFLPHSATRHHKHWIYQTIYQAKSIKFINKALYRSKYYMGQTCCPSKSWVIKNRSLSKLDNTFNNNSTFIMVGASSFSEPYLCKKSPLHSATKICSSTSANFHLPIPPLLLHKFLLTIPTNISFLYTSPMFDFPAFAYYHPNNIYQNLFPTSAI